jgi:hypothetical protein
MMAADFKVLFQHLYRKNKKNPHKQSVSQSVRVVNLLHEFELRTSLEQSRTSNHSTQMSDVTVAAYTD